MTEQKSSYEQTKLNQQSSFLNNLNEKLITVDDSINSKLFHSLSEPDQNSALELANQIEHTNYETILQFGVEAQQKLKHFTNNLLIQVQRNDTSPIRDVLFKLIEQLEKIDPDSLVEEKKGFFAKFFNRAKSTIQEQISHFKRLSIQIDRLSIQLLHAQKGLLSDIDMLEKLYNLNEEFYHNINIHIAALDIKKQHLITNLLPKLQKESVSDSDSWQQQKLSDLENAIEWIDKRMYDLQLSREIALQSSPQIRLIQKTNQLLVEKIQTSVLSSIPLWQTQISILVNINNQRQMKITEKRLMNLSEDMMKKNAKMIQSSALGSKKIKSITHEDIDSFKETQLKLLESIEETLRVQAESNEQHHLLESNMEKLTQK
ncbi:toxic anion resistance protein [Ureibacillus massiliensis]|uniref:toxic anion resistance protein n=1 Tax=Ureibacillus massiliensis TaxID=292806 RepID=UPI00068967A0|nr:toxic anion resistance protein [Ureibacillus massiliensis]